MSAKSLDLDGAGTWNEIKNLLCFVEQIHHTIYICQAGFDLWPMLRLSSSKEDT